MSARRPAQNRGGFGFGPFKVSVEIAVSVRGCRVKIGAFLVAKEIAAELLNDAGVDRVPEQLVALLIGGRLRIGSGSG